MQIVVGLILAWGYLYFVFQVGKIQEGKIKDIVTFVLLCICTIPASIFSLEYLGIIASMVILILFDYFYDDERFSDKWKWIVLFGVITSIVFILSNMFKSSNKISILATVFLVLSITLSFYRKLFKQKYNIIAVVINLIYIYLSHYLERSQIQGIVLILSISTFIAFESMLSSYNTTFKRKASEFQQELLANQYEEIKTIYLNMRGFRHDYHNHIQVLKAYMSMNKTEQVNKYLLELEGELERIDSRICSGNLMLDAILNSKISVAEKNEINIICKANASEKLPITDIDLCVILGNLLDNAIESCKKIEENRFIRIYVAIIKKQLYISIQNSAKEELDFNEKNYISTKRGNHGLGMKRVKVLVDKYDGYLNLQNEPGIFASEVSIPI